MRNARGTMLVAALAAALSWVATEVAAEDKPTAERPKAESFFADLKKCCAAKDAAGCTAALPSSLVAGWPDEAKDDAKAWREGFCACVAAAEVVWVHESGDTAIARCKCEGPCLRDVHLQFDGKRWTVASPWAYCVSGGEIAKANGKGPSHVKLKTRGATANSYGASAFSFTHATADVAKVKNRADAWYCPCGQIHLKGALVSQRKAKKLADLDGLQTGGDWMDEFNPKADTVYVISCKDGRRDFQIGMHVTDVSDKAIEFDWCLLAAGRNAPADIRVAQPLVTNDAADGVDALCGTKAK
jgi:hypothetical protein